MNNDASSTRPALNARPVGVVLPAAKLLLAAVALGLIYNQASPLGVRFRKAATVDPIAQKAPASAGASSGYVNETVALKWELASPRPSAPASAPPPALAPFPELTWMQVKRLLASKEIVLVDARTAANYQTSHIPDAVSLPSTATTNELSAFAAKHATHTPLVIYCGSITCRMSHQLAVRLATEYGFTNLRTMPGGFAQYLAEEPKTAAGTNP